MQRGVASLLALTLLLGCTTWRPVPVQPAQLAGTEVASPLRVTRADGQRFVLRSPVVTLDSIVADQGSVALTDIRLIESRRPSRSRTVALIAAAPLILYGALLGLCAVVQGGECRFE